MKIDRIKKIIKKVEKDRRNVLDLLESRELLKSIGIKLNKSGLAQDIHSAKQISEKIGFPVAMKIVSPDILHKTEAGGVLLGLRDTKSAMQGFKKIIENVNTVMPRARITGVLIEEMLSGNELIVGTVKDRLFGNMIMFGIGGVLVELYRDVTFRLIPVKRVDVLEMLEEIKAKEILNGYRKSPGVNKEELIEIILNISELVENHPEIESMEVNPFIITEEGLVAIDARVILKN
jgi:acyl-CoA synthetase (NDP forming)